MPDFEYDEDTEFSASEDEGYGEDSEAAGDEAAIDEGEAEGFASFGEDSEAAGDEAAIDESEPEDAEDEAVMGASAQLRADAARNRQADWARKIADDQRLEAQRAATVQRTITDRLRSIRPGGGTRVYSVGSLQGAGVVTAILPNGRQSRMRIIPTMAPISEVNRLRSAITVNDKRQAAAIANNSRAIAALTSVQAAAAKKLTEQQVKSDKDLAKRIVEGDNRLDRRITKELSAGTGSLGKHGKRMMYLLRRQRQRSIMNSVLLATAAPFFVAYGDRESPFTKNNAILTGSLLFWLTGDELLDQFGGKSGLVTGGSATWSYLAPFANAGTAWFFLDDKQRERFVSDVTEVTGSTITLNLEKMIAKGSIDDFKGKAHNVVATVTDGPGGRVTPSLSDDTGNLTLAVTKADGSPVAPTDKTKVAWILDTQVLPKIPAKSA